MTGAHAGSLLQMSGQENRSGRDHASFTTRQPDRPILTSALHDGKCGMGNAELQHSAFPIFGLCFVPEMGRCRITAVFALDGIAASSAPNDYANHCAVAAAATSHYRHSAASAARGCMIVLSLVAGIYRSHSSRLQTLTNWRPNRQHYRSQMAELSSRTAC